MPTQQGPVIRLTDFSGGLNVRDTGPELGDNDLAQAFNVTLDERGAFGQRLGTSLVLNSYTATTGFYVTNIYYSNIFNKRFVQCGEKLQDETATVIKTFTTAARCAMVDFAGVLCIVHPVDGFFTWNGAAITAIAAGPKADALVVWQSRLWANDKSGTNKPRVNFSDPGSTTVWGHNVDVREVDDSQVVALFSGQGQDIKGAPGLLVFKQRSSYRINDSTTGAFTTLDPFIGAGGALCVGASSGKIFVLGFDGIFTTDGSSGLQKVSGKLDPWFKPDFIDYSTAANWAVGSRNDKVYFSFTPFGSSVNAYTFEHHALIGWFTINDIYAGCWTLDPRDGFLHYGSTLFTQTARKFPLSSLGDPPGNLISNAQTKWIELNSGQDSYLNKMRLNYRSANGIGLLMDVYKNYDQVSTLQRSLPTAASSSTLHGGYVDQYNLGRTRAVSFFFSAPNAGIQSIPFPNIGSRGVGGWAVYGIDLEQYSALGRF